MSQVFADTSFYIAFANPRDRWHEVAQGFSLSFAGGMVTTEFVLIEFANYLCAPQDRALFLRFHTMLREDESTEIIPASAELFQQGLSLYQRRPDKGWSLTDCISMSVMQECGIAEVLTTDHHFEQAGFNTIPKNDS